MIDVIIITYNRCEELKDVLGSLNCQEETEFIDYEITVVDNNSSDATRDVVEKFQRASNRRVRYVFEKTQGQAAARNRGIKETKGNIIAFIDDDAIASEGWLNVIHQMFSSSDADCLTGKVVPLCKKPEWYHEEMHGVICDIDHGDTTFVLNDYMPTVNMAVRRSVFEKYGGFRLDLGEDGEFSERVLNGGCRIFYCPEMLVYHKIMSDRLTKGYFRYWFFSRGAASYMMPLEHNSRSLRLFRIPLWRYREFLTALFGWLKYFLIRNPAQQFMHETRLCSFFGYARSAWGGGRKLLRPDTIVSELPSDVD